MRHAAASGAPGRQPSRLLTLGALSLLSSLPLLSTAKQTPPVLGSTPTISRDQALSQGGQQLIFMDYVILAVDGANADHYVPGTYRCANDTLYFQHDVRNRFE